MKLIEDLAYATLDLSSYSSGTELGDRIPLIYPQGHASDVLVYVLCASVAGGAAHSIEAFLTEAASGGRLEPLNIGLPAEATTVEVSHTLPTDAGRILCLYRHKLEAAAPIFGNFLTFTVTDDRTGGDVVVGYALFDRGR